MGDILLCVPHPACEIKSLLCQTGMPTAAAAASSVAMAVSEGPTRDEVLARKFRLRQSLGVSIEQLPRRSSVCR